MNEQERRRLRACGFSEGPSVAGGGIVTADFGGWIGPDGAMFGVNPPDLTDDANAARYVLPVVKNHMDSMFPDYGRWTVQAWFDGSVSITSISGDSFGQALVAFLDALIEAGLV